MSVELFESLSLVLACIMSVFVRHIFILNSLLMAYFTRRLHSLVYVMNDFKWKQFFHRSVRGRFIQCFSQY